MRHLTVLLFLVACEKSGPVEATPGSATAPVPAIPEPVADAAVATVPIDAAKIAHAGPSPYSAEELEAMVNVMTTTVDSSIPAADLGTQIDNARNSGSVRAGGRINIRQKRAFGDSTLLVETVLAKITSAYMTGLKRCYTTYLKKDPVSRGRLALTFTVSETGRTKVPKASGFAKEVDDCIAGQMASWRFPIPKDKGAAPIDAAFRIDLQLVPD